MSCELHGHDAINTYEESTFRAALPYGIGTLATAVCGVGIILTAPAAATAVKVAGIVLAFIGAVTFMGTVLCGIANSGNPLQFRAEVFKYMAVAVGQAIVQVALQIATSVLDKMISNCLNGRR